MVNPEVIRRRVAALDEYLGVLRELREYDEGAFRQDPKIYGSAERFLHLSIESLIDIGAHIVADENLGDVDWQSDIPRILQENKIIDGDQAEAWTGMIGFRNILVHEYTRIERSIVYDVLKNRLSDIESLRDSLAKA